MGRAVASPRRVVPPRRRRRTARYTLRRTPVRTSPAVRRSMRPVTKSPRSCGKLEQLPEALDGCVVLEEQRLHTEHRGGGDVRRMVVDEERVFRLDAERLQASSKDA